MSWSRKDFLKDGSWRRIFVSVLLIHMALLVGVWLNHRQACPIVAKKPLAVRVVEPAIQESAPPSPAIQAPRKASPSPVAKTSPPKEKKKAEPALKAAPTPSVVKSSPDIRKEELLHQLDKGLTALADLPPPSAKGESKKQFSPAARPSLTSKGSPTSSERASGYEEELVTRLRLLLRLPEYGAVRVSMVLNRKGQVQKVSILSTESLKNQDYIEKTLPGIVFPGFVAHFEGEEQHEFIISLSNEM